MMSEVTGDWSAGNRQMGGGGVGMLEEGEVWIGDSL